MGAVDALRREELPPPAMQPLEQLEEQSNIFDGIRKTFVNAYETFFKDSPTTVQASVNPLPSQVGASRATGSQIDLMVDGIIQVYNDLLDNFSIDQILSALRTVAAVHGHKVKQNVEVETVVDEQRLKNEQDKQVKEKENKKRAWNDGWNLMASCTGIGLQLSSVFLGALAGMRPTMLQSIGEAVKGTVGVYTGNNSRAMDAKEAHIAGKVNILMTRTQDHANRTQQNPGAQSALQQGNQDEQKRSGAIEGMTR